VLCRRAAGASRSGLVGAVLCQWRGPLSDRLVAAVGGGPGAALLGPRETDLAVERATSRGNVLQQTRPDLFAQPAVRFALAAAQRRSQPRLAERFYAAQRTGAIDRAWRQCAQLEQWLAEPRGVPAKPVLHCRQAASRPHLDGKLDDSLWQAAEVATLRSPLGDDGAWLATVRMAYDASSSTWRSRCARPPGFATNRRPVRDARRQSRRPRSRGTVPRSRRDYATYYHLAVDDRGFTRDDCWGDATWDPTWFVAALSSAEG